MPILPILDEKGELLPFASIQTFAVMLYPRDEEAQMQFLAAHLSQVCDEASNQDVPAFELGCFAFIIPALYQAPQTPQRILKDGLHRAKRASLAGVDLLVRLSCARHHPRHIAAHRATTVISETFSGYPTYGGEPARAGESTVNHARAEFRPAAHLLAMHWWLIREADTDGSPFLSGPTFEDETGLRWALAIAERIRRLGEEAGFLRPDEVWRVPPDLELPTEEFHPEPLPPGIVALLDRSFPS